MSHHAEYERGGTGQAAARGADRLDSSIRRTLQQPGVRLGQIGADGREIQDGSDASKRSNEFPARLVPKDDYDNRIAVKQDMIGGGVGSGGTDNRDAIYGNPVQMVMPISERDVDWYEGKRKASNYLQFKEWLHSTIDMSDPVQVALARQNGNATLTLKISSTSSFFIQNWPPPQPTSYPKPLTRPYRSGSRVAGIQ